MDHVADATPYSKDPTGIFGGIFGIGSGMAYITIGDCTLLSFGWKDSSDTSV
jgi:hypothetical protein